MADVAQATITSAQESDQDVAETNGSDESSAETASDTATESASETVADTETKQPADAASEPVIFRGSQRNVVVATGLLLAALMAFSMGLTTTFFAEATAWTFAIWGALLLFSSMLDLYQTYEVHDDALYIHNNVRFWSLNKRWAWDEVNRLDVVVDRTDARLQDAEMQVYHKVEGEIVREREDRTFNPELAQLIIEKAELQPVDDNNPTDLTRLPVNRKATYHWSKTGSIA